VDAKDAKDAKVVTRLFRSVLADSAQFWEHSALDLEANVTSLGPKEEL
jgi:hypothetical protein